jgi:hypothetical protein
MRRALLSLVVLAACATADAPSDQRWIEFHYAPGWFINGNIQGSITQGGIVHARAWPKVSGKAVTFERQLRPEDIGRIRSAIKAHLLRFGPKAGIREGMSDAGDLTIEVHESGVRTLSFHLSGPCSDLSEAEAYALWNDIMQSIRSPDYDARDHEFKCE